jgi:hypothetical protein
MPFMLRALNIIVTLWILIRSRILTKHQPLKMFHSLTDGTGHWSFLKSTIYTYLQLQGIKLPENTSILTAN